MIVGATGGYLCWGIFGRVEGVRTSFGGHRQNQGHPRRWHQVREKSGRFGLKKRKLYGPFLLALSLDNEPYRAVRSSLMSLARIPTAYTSIALFNKKERRYTCQNPCRGRCWGLLLTVFGSTSYGVASLCLMSSRGEHLPYVCWSATEMVTIPYLTLISSSNTVCWVRKRYLYHPEEVLQMTYGETFLLKWRYNMQGATSVDWSF